MKNAGGNGRCSILRTLFLKGLKYGGVEVGRKERGI